MIANSTFEEIIQAIQKYLTIEEPQYEKLVTSGAKYSGWLQPRLQSNEQILINAFTGTQHDVLHVMERAKFTLEKEFGSVNVSVKQLFYPFADVQAMKDVIARLIEHFKSTISVEETINEIKPEDRNADKTGYIMVTIAKGVFIGK